MKKLLMIIVTLLITSYSFGQVASRGDIEKLKSRYASCIQDTQKKFGSDSTDSLIEKFQVQSESSQLEINFDVVDKYIAMLSSDKKGNEVLDLLQENEKVATYTFLNRIIKSSVRKCEAICFIRGFEYGEKGCQLNGKNPMECRDLEYGVSISCNGKRYHKKGLWPANYCGSINSNNKRGTSRYCSSIDGDSDIECTMYYNANKTHSKAIFVEVESSSLEACDEVNNLNRPFPEKEFDKENKKSNSSSTIRKS